MFKNVLIVEYQSEWRRALSEIFRCYQKIKKYGFCIDESSCFDDAIDKLENKNYDLIIINENLDPKNRDNTFDSADQSLDIYLSKGLIICEYVREKNRFQNTLKILLKTQNLNYNKDVLDNYKKKCRERYGLDYVYILEPGQPGSTNDLMDYIFNLFGGKSKQANFMKIQQSKNQNTNIDLREDQLTRKDKITSLQSEISSKYKVSQILNEKIAELEIEEIITADASSRFESNKRIAGLKERKICLGQEIEELENKLSQVCKNTN